MSKSIITAGGNYAEDYRRIDVSNIQTGTRRDGSIKVQRLGKIVFFTSDFITGGSQRPACNYTLPVGFRPNIQRQQSVCLQASGNVTGYGYVNIQTNGTFEFHLSHTADAEIHFTAS